MAYFDDRSRHRLKLCRAAFGDDVTSEALGVHPSELSDISESLEEVPAEVLEGLEELANQLPEEDSRSPKGEKAEYQAEDGSEYHTEPEVSEDRIDAPGYGDARDASGDDLKSFVEEVDESSPALRETGEAAFVPRREPESSRRPTLDSLLLEQELASNFLSRGGMSVQDYRLATMARLQIEMMIIGLYQASVPRPGQGWDASRRASEMDRRRVNWQRLEQEENRDFSGIRGFLNRLIGRRRIGLREFYDQRIRNNPNNALNFMDDGR